MEHFKLSVKFGTSGARGLVDDFTEETCEYLVTAFLKSMALRFDFRRILVGRDLRPSSPEISRICVKLAQNLGYEVIDCGVIPTPALALEAISQVAPAVMITGSHIPFDRNGMKFYRPDGEINKSDELEILRYSYSPSVNTASPQSLYAYAPVHSTYISRYTNCFSGMPLSGWRVGVYQHSAAGRDTNVEILQNLGAETVSIGRCEHFVPVDTEAVSPEDTLLAKKWVVEYGLNALLTTDGDGDRPLLADETGTWWRGDVLGLVCAKELGIDAVAVPVSCNTAIEKSGYFSHVARTKIGSPYVIEAMEKLADQFGTAAGFEANGGFLLGSSIACNGKILSALPTRDALLPALTVMVAASSQDKPLSALLSGLPERCTASDRLKEFPTELSQQLILQWTEQPQQLIDFLSVEASVDAVDLTDGLRMTMDNGNIIHLRPSGNAPELRCYAESHCHDHALLLVSQTLDKISELR